MSVLTAVKGSGPELTALFGIGLAALLVVAVVVAPPISTKATRACDQAVSTLLNTKDAVELERSRILIDQLSCSVAKRLPEAS
jgi:hypothetical protein